MTFLRKLFFLNSKGMWDVCVWVCVYVYMLFADMKI